MAGETGLNIVTNGLILYYDATNSKSLVSGSTTWIDLSRSNINGTLTNGPIYTSSFGGGVVCDGVDDKIAIPFTASSPSVQPYTYEIVFSPNTGSITFKGLMGYSSYPISGFSLGLYNNSSIYFQAYSGSVANAVGLLGYFNPTIGAVSVVTATFINRDMKIYYNGNLFASTTIAFDPPSNSNPIVIAGTVQGGWGPSNITVYNAKIYNRAITAAEVKQNYNTMKSRFNI
jgi:hypothetical protein